MRALKFRAWDTVEKRWIDWFEQTVCCEERDFYASWLTGSSGKKLIIMNDVLPNIEIMQFTGLHDKNGKEIYESDIVNVPYNHIGNITVIFAEGKYNIANYNYTECEVIGNVYENRQKK